MDALDQRIGGQAGAVRWAVKGSDTGRGDYLMKKIPLTQGKVALIDDEDFEVVSRYRWYALRAKRTYYAVTNVRINGKALSLRMHRLILGLRPGDGLEGDHQNHNGLDNRRENLRVASGIDNRRNMLIRSDSSSGFKGVNRRKAQTPNPYRAHITINGTTQHLGVFATAIEAARVYDAKARELFGEFACLNF